MVVRAGYAENRELRKKAERLAAVEAEKEMLEKQLDGLALERDTYKKDCAEADKTIAAHRTTIAEQKQQNAVLEAKLKHKKEDAAERLAALTPGFAGAEIANVTNEAAIIAAMSIRNRGLLVSRGALGRCSLWTVFLCCFGTACTSIDNVGGGDDLSEPPAAPGETEKTRSTRRLDGNLPSACRRPSGRRHRRC